MKTNNNIQSQIEAVLESGKTIQTAQVSPFFKDKTLEHLFSEKEEKQSNWSWFTPQLQLATLVCVVLLNVFAFTKIEETNYNENVSQFAESYGMTTTETSIFN